MKIRLKMFGLRNRLQCSNTVYMNVGGGCVRRRQQQAGAPGGLPGVGAMPGAGARQHPAAHARRARARLHPRLLGQAVRARRLLQGQSIPPPPTTPEHHHDNTIKWLPKRGV